MATTLYLPDPGAWPSTLPDTPVTPRDTLNASATSVVDTQASVSAENAPLRVIYGEVRLGPLICTVLPYLQGNVILAVWGHGEVDEIVSMSIDDVEIALGSITTLPTLGKDGTFTGGGTTPINGNVRNYTGKTAQTADTLLIDAFAGQGLTYADNLAGICYSVIYVPTGTSTGFPRINAKIRGLKVWTGATTEWSDNPAYCLADFITNATYGAKRTVDWASVASVAADCNALVGGEKRRTLNLALETVQPVQNWLDTLQTYAGCWITQDGADLKLIADKAGSVVASISHAAGQIQRISGMKKRGVQGVPTVMSLTYTDTTALPHKPGTVTVYADGVLAGTKPRRESTVSLPGINRYSQAKREAIERLNKLALNDLSMTLGVFDEALSLEVGDIVAVTHPIGIPPNKQMRVLSVVGEYGRFELGLLEYDPAVYNDSVATAPTWADTDLPDPTLEFAGAVNGIVPREYSRNDLNADMQLMMGSGDYLYGGAGITANPATGVVKAPTFQGALSGNASTATNVAWAGLTGTTPTFNQSTTGNAATASDASKLNGYARRVDLDDFTTWDAGKVGPVGWYNKGGGPSGTSTFWHGWRSAMADTAYGSEIAINHTADEAYYRRRTNGAYGSWRRIIDSVNIGAQTTWASNYLVGNGLGSSYNLNTLTSAGSFRVEAGTVNKPSGADDYAPILVFGGGDTRTQLYGGHGTGKLWYRSGNNTGATWQGWREVADTTSVQTIYNKTLDAASSLLGNSATASKLQTSRLLNGVAFDGSADVSLPGGIFQASNGQRANGGTGYADLNDWKEPGSFNYVDSVTNKPNNGWGFLQVYRHYNTDANGVYCVQVAHDMNGSYEGRQWTRRGLPTGSAYGANWSAWYETVNTVATQTLTNKRLDSTSYLGIGTSGSTSKFHQVNGTAGSPYNGTTYTDGNTARFESYTNDTTVRTGGFLNAHLTPSMVFKTEVGPAEVNSPTAVLIELLTTSPRATTGDESKENLIGLAIRAAANATLTAGQTQRSVWGLNIGVAVGPGSGDDPTGKNPADDHCGIEVDVSNDFANAVADPFAPGHSYGYWAQAHSNTGRRNGSAFFVTDLGSGWRNAYYVKSNVSDYLGYFESTIGCNGLHVKTQGSAGSYYLLTLQNAAGNLFNVRDDGQINFGGSSYHGGHLVGLTDANHGMIFDSGVNGPQFRGYDGFVWKTGFGGATERMRLTSTALSLDTHYFHHNTQGAGYSGCSTFSWGHGGNLKIGLPAGHNGAANGDAYMYLWMSEPGATWTDGGIARNMANTSGSFPRINSNLSGQMIRFRDDNVISVTMESSGGTRTYPMDIGGTGTGYIAMSGASLGGWSSNGNLSVLRSESSGYAASFHNNYAGGGGALLARIDNTAAALAGFYYGTTAVGTITTNGTTTAYNTSSDYRLKTDVAPLAGALERVMALRPVQFTWRTSGVADRGFIAHELQDIDPYAVTGEKDAVDEDGQPVYQGIDTSHLIADLAAAIQAQQTQIYALTQQLIH